MKMKLFRLIVFYIGILTGVLLLAFQLRRGYSRLDWSLFHLSSWLYIILGFFAISGAIILQIFTWKTIMEGLSVPLTFRQVFQGYLASFMPKYIPGSIWGYLSRSEWLYNKYTVPRYLTNIGSVIEVLVAFITGIIVIAINNARNNLGINQFLPLVIALLIPITCWLLIRRVNRRKIRISWLKTRLPPGALDKFTLKIWLMIIFTLLLQWMLYGLAIFEISTAFATGGQFTIHLWMSYSAAYSISWMGGFLVFFAPAGIGYREVLLMELLISNIGSQAVTAAVAIGLRLLISVSELLGAIIGILLSKKIQTGT